jgi:DNA-binding LacI/PurR family transcriptional regulator
MKTVGLYGAPFAGLSLFQNGLRDVTSAQLIHIGSGPFTADYLALADAWIWLHEENLAALPVLLASGKPAVSRSLSTLPLGLAPVHMDDESAARQLAEHQIAQGARSLHYWGLPAAFSRRRSAGVRAAAEAAGLPFSEHPDLPATVAALRAAHSSGPAGFVGMNDEWCHRVAEALHGSALAVPRDVLLAGFDNLPATDTAWSLPLTTVVLPLREQGRLCARLLTAGQPPELRIHLTATPVLLLRSSTLRP